MNMQPWKNQTVLIVDDSLEICRQLTALYSELGFNVVGTAHNGLEALQFLDSQQVDFVSLDIIMQVMHGVECYRLIKKGNPTQKCLFVSILAKDQTFIDAFKDEIPPQIFVGKPIRDEQLLSGLRFIYGIEEASGPIIGLETIGSAVTSETKAALPSA